MFLEKQTRQKNEGGVKGEEKWEKRKKKIFENIENRWIMERLIEYEKVKEKK